MPKKKSNVSYINLSMRWMREGETMPSAGLCASISKSIPNRQGRNLLELFYPTDEDSRRLWDAGYSVAYWASGVKPLQERHYYGFTPLRQTIMAFLAVINEEV